MTRIAVLDDYQHAALAAADWSVVTRDAKVVVFDRHIPEGEVAAALARFDIVVAMRERTRFPSALLAALPDLRLLVTTGRRNASIDLNAARAQGVTVCGTDSLSSTTAELTWALILGLLRRIPQEDRSLREGRWQTTLGECIEGATLGLIGFGNVGSRVARVGLAFGMKVLAHSRSLTPDAASGYGVTAASPDEVLAQADVVSLHVPLNDATRGLIGAEALSRMKAGSFLVNTSRGPIVDSQAVIDALVLGHLRGYAADVYDVEPLPAGDPILTAPNTVLTPHLGYVTRQNYEVYFTQVVEDIRAFLDGAPIRVLA